MGCCLATLALLESRPAHAFEGLWHLGMGAGVSVPNDPYRAAAALSLHGAYGISDVFDVRLTATGSLLHLSPDGGRQNSLSLGTLGIAYKLDIIEWIPYCGVRAGFFVFGKAPEGGAARQGGALGGMCGIDYAFSRSAALGVELSRDFLLPEGHVFGALLHAEYRWGL
ncbi:MAG: hypothetical protein ACOY0T_02735 [Myxococcota bacterium]